MKDPHLRPFASIRGSDLRAHTPIRRHADSLRPRGTRGCVCGIAASALILSVFAPKVGLTRN
jgi:hypothetical protein